MRDKIGPRPPGFDAEAIARAEAALKGLADNFQAWMNEDVEKLEAARQAARLTGFDEAKTEELFCRAHDVKGLGTTYEYPLATAIAGSLCKLIDGVEARALARKNPSLIEAHVDAIRAIVRDRVKNAEDPVGKAIAATLRTHVYDLMGPD